MHNSTPPSSKNDFGEKCGVIGVYTASDHAAYYVRRSLATLQHRGQESAGISIVNPKGKIITYKGLGLIPHVLPDRVIKKLGDGKLGIGHNRYGTSGSSSADNAQPISLKQGKFQIAIGHNGNIPDLSNIRKRLKFGRKATSDTFLAASLLLNERTSFPTWEETLMNILPEFRGAYNFVMLTDDGSLFGMRDPYGIRPLCLGKLHDGWIIASESVALDSVGAAFVRDIKNGEIVKISKDGKLSSYFFGEPKRPQYCLFEYIYFARPDSFLNGKRVRAGREESGRLLGARVKKKKIKLDLIIPTFDSGYPAAKGVAEALKLPIVDAITTSHYVGRTFIQPGQENRVTAVNGKHNIIPDEIRGKNVIVVDDSAVRLTTSKALVQGLKLAGAKAVYMGIASPPVVDQCDMGIDMRSKKDLPAAQFEKQEFEIIERKIADQIGADDVIYLPIDETTQAMGGKKDDFYHFPFGGKHPIRSKQETFKKRKTKRSTIPNLCIFISGSGTNLQKIIDSIEREDIKGNISSILSNKEDAYGIVRAKKHNIATKVIQFTEKALDQQSRREYDRKLISYIKETKPDIIILAGWMMILGKEFLKAMQKMEIPVLNLHPALLTKNNDASVATSRGNIPVIRGAHAIKVAFDKNLPVSGVTVHQVLPGDTFDVGPIILKAEVRRSEHDTLESFEKKIHEAEHLILPTAIKRVLHVMSHYNIDISTGDFPW